MGDKDKMQRELMSKLAELESRHKRRLSPDDIRYRLRMDTDKAQKDSPVISKSFSVKQSTCSKSKNPSMTNSVERYRKSETAISHTEQRTNTEKHF